MGGGALLPMDTKMDFAEIWTNYVQDGTMVFVFLAHASARGARRKTINSNGRNFMLEKVFKLRENHTNVKTEIMAGITTFMTMAYILAVNPSVLSAAGMDPNAILIATSLSAFIGTALMALLANYPFALAPGMGLNAYFAYTVVLKMGYTWQMALMAVFAEGIIFIILSLTNVREALFNAIPTTLKSAVSVGIGLFIAFVGLQNAKLIVNSDSTLLTYQSFKGETFHSVGVGAILALIGVLIIAIMLVKQVKGAILYGIVITWVLGILCELCGVYIPDAEAGMYSVIPTSFVSFDFSALGQTFGQVFKVDFAGLNVLDFFAVMFAFLFVDLFDTLGTLIGVASKADMLDENGRLPRIKGALLADAIATSAGAVLGTSTTTTYVESASGVTEGGRTGLTAMTTGVLFLLAVIFSPLFLTIPSFATAPALIVVGFYMLGAVAKIDFDDPSDAIPAFLTIVAMPLAYSISEGIAIGVISWTLLNLITGKAKEKKISPLMYVLTVLFILKYVLL
ncbi:putative permease [Subdoligranulum variabile DSM 15176]|uniref:Permease n=2 Tax=Subdoligranulum variabile TaxID=214851 RepID=D1PJ67_9FIRM|nr:putative permease [Subdoligranulum variabile DSM 15176]